MHAVTLDAPRPARPDTRPPFAAMAEEHLDDVYGYLLYLCRNATLAEDLASETFEKAFRLWRRFDPRRGTTRTWLLAIARTTALDWFRAEERRRRREQAVALPDLHEDELAEGLSAELEQALAEPERRRARGDRAARRARAGRRGGGTRARHQPDRVLDASEPRPEETRGEDDR